MIRRMASCTSSVMRSGQSNAIRLVQDLLLLTFLHLILNQHAQDNHSHSPEQHGLWTDLADDEMRTNREGGTQCAIYTNK